MRAVCGHRWQLWVWAGRGRRCHLLGPHQHHWRGRWRCEIVGGLISGVIECGLLVCLLSGVHWLWTASAICAQQEEEDVGAPYPVTRGNLPPPWLPLGVHSLPLPGLHPLWPDRPTSEHEPQQQPKCRHGYAITRTTRYTSQNGAVNVFPGVWLVLSPSSITRLCITICLLQFVMGSLRWWSCARTQRMTGWLHLGPHSWPTLTTLTSL